MDPDLNPDAPDQLRSELSDEELAAADQARQDAFAAAFGETVTETASTQADPASTAAVHTPAATVKPDTTTTTETPGGKTKPPANDEDPFRDLNPKVRDMLAEIPDLKRDLESMKGRVAPTQQKLAKLERENERLQRELQARGTTPAAATTAAPSDLEAKVRGELPEVADLIEERIQAGLKGLARTPAAADDDDPGTSTETTTTIDDDPAIKSLKKVHPDWDKTMTSTDYRLWVSARGADYQREINNSDDPAVVASSLTEFKAHRQRMTETTTREASSTATRRQNRTERGVEPGSHRAPAGSDQKTEHDAFVEAYNSP